jgi:hypothetical protein
MSDMEWVRAKDDEARRQEAELLRKAKARAAERGKEPFSYEALIRLYDPTSEMATVIHDPAATAAALEDRYYVDYPDVLTIREFAERMEHARRSR